MIRFNISMLPVVLALVGCGADSGARGELDGRTFLLDSADGYTLVEGTTIRLSFDDDEVSFYAGCNHFSGQYVICDGRFCLEDYFSTQIGCPPALSEQDNWVVGFMTDSPLFALSGDRLTLTGADATLEFLDREIADPDRPLWDSLWIIDSFIDASTVSSIQLSSDPTVRFGSDGVVSVFTTCSTGEGRFVEIRGGLELSQVSYTEEPCDENGSQAAHDHITAVLADGVVTFAIEAARLTLSRGELGLGAFTD